MPPKTSLPSAQPPSPDRSSEPRSRLLAGEAVKLSDRDLLAAFLGPTASAAAASSARGADAGVLAAGALAALGGFRGLVTASAETFCAVPGLGRAGYARLHAALEILRRALAEEMRFGDVLDRPEHVHGFLRLWLLDRSYEVFCALFLDGRNRLIAAEELFRGTLGQTAVYPREVARRALQVNAAAVLVAHNHPSGTAEPSAADEHLTGELRRALALIDVRVLDHFIVAGPRVYSFAANGRL